jgi:tol-pal system protein YbgF
MAGWGARHGRKRLIKVKTLMPAGALALAGLILAGSHLALAQDDGDSGSEMRTRIQRLERDLRDLQQEVYRGTGVGPRTLTPPPASADVPPAQSGPMSQRVSDMEDTLQRLTGQIEELQNQNRQPQQKVDRLQRALDYEQNSGASPSAAPPGAQTHADEGSAPGVPTTQPRTALAPGPSNLGSIPRNTVLPQPKPGATAGGVEPAPAPPPTSGRVASLPPTAAPPTSAPSSGNAQAEYDSAMALLRKAQYQAAQQAFRAFADAHPRDARAPDALFWTGDIAYSARRDYASAARAFAELLKKYGKAGRAPESMLKLGLSLLGLGQKQEGCATLAALPVKYANAAPALLSRATAERRRAACT